MEGTSPEPAGRGRISRPWRSGNCREIRIHAAGKCGRHRNLTPVVEDRPVGVVLGLDCRDRVAAERQPDRRIGDIGEADEHIGQLGRVAGLGMVETGGSRPGPAGGLRIIADDRRTDRQRCRVEEIRPEIARFNDDFRVRF